RSKLTNTHGSSALEHRQRLAVLETHVRLLPPRRRAERAAARLLLRALLQGPEVDDVNAEQRFDRRANVALARLGMRLERVLLALLVGGGRFLGYERANHRSKAIRHRSYPSSWRRSWPPASSSVPASSPAPLARVSWSRPSGRASRGSTSSP